MNTNGIASNHETLLLGAVAYDSKVVTIWEGFKSFFESRGLPFDYILFSNYERQVEAHIAGVIHVAWNSPLAWIRCKRLARLQHLDAKALAMRDTDQDLTSIILVRSKSDISNVSELRGKTVAVGAVDSPQATMIPLLHLQMNGLQPGVDFDLQYNDILIGKHGDHIGGEREAVRALLSGNADAACIVDSNQLLFTKEGTIPPGTTRILTQTDPYDHCNFTILSNAPIPLIDRFRNILLDMSYSDSSLRGLMDLEGLKAWRVGRNEKYALLDRAVNATGFYDHYGRITNNHYRY